MNKLAHIWRTVRAYRAQYKYTSRGHGHGHRAGALVCGWCLAEIPAMARDRVYEQEHAR